MAFLKAAADKVREKERKRQAELDALLLLSDTEKAAKLVEIEGYFEEHHTISSIGHYEGCQPTRILNIRA